MPDESTTGSWRLLRPLLFRLDPELAHHLTLTLAGHWARVLDQLSPPARERAPTAVNNSLGRQLMGLTFPNPVGLAAGLDKDATAVQAWQRLGFGFVEVGTVTAHPQPGNPRPRLFRFPPQGALVNRMGFNNQGARCVAQRLRALREQGEQGDQSESNRLRVPLGVNIGKSKRASSDEAAADYQQSFAALGEWADYVVVNISSPNTPGLRDLQRVDDVRRILSALQMLNQRLAHPRPLLIKLAPDLADEDAITCAQAALDEGGAGLILTNTTIDHSALPNPPAGLSGGLSGRPLFTRSTALLATLRAALGEQAALIGVGGIMSPQDAMAKFAAGADLIQLYTGLIYQGPALVKRILDILPPGNGVHVQP
ncbi:MULTISPECIES: quinone-dependent dihydroorotate dehydrogenase [Thiorhodovibrio]|uniref:quinone-dependent dihydroorotate dehydrogenase n=1 Tax=Thiorhodovibrio TaxID=61593 RepID=UPI0019138463|nr:MULTISPECIES: quinone-dependent dihydroorotate dehydrogenase [Thiorhodovibrio]MBK5970812.1 dihydroorotate dehydrogenase (quinone) [Thiorhodovibrio winogradskyi]